MSEVLGAGFFINSSMVRSHYYLSMASYYDCHLVFVLGLIVMKPFTNVSELLNWSF